MSAVETTAPIEGKDGRGRTRAPVTKERTMKPIDMVARGALYTLIILGLWLAVGWGL